MKEKFKKLLLVVLVGIFAFSSLNIVNAISSRGDMPVNSEIVGFNVFIFNDKGMTQTQSEVTDENIKHFPVEGLRYTTTDDVKSENGYTLVSTRLNVDGGVESLEKIAENIASQNKASLKDGNNGKYLITFSVKYKLTLPDNTSVYDSDYANVFSGDQKLLKEENEANASIGLDQMLIAGIYDSNTDTVDWNNQSQYVYNVEGGTHTFTSRSHLMPSFDQYLIFTNDKKPGDKEIEDPYNFVMANNYGELYRYMMYIEEMSSPIVDDDPSADEPSTDEPSVVDPTPSDPSDSENNNKPSDTNPSKPSDEDDNKPSDVTPSDPSDEDDTKKPSDVIPSDSSDEDDNKNENIIPVTPSDNNNNNNNSGTSTSTTTNSDSSNNATSKTTGQTLSVPNTANDSNSSLTLSGILLLVSGSGIVTLTKKEENSI